MLAFIDLVLGMKTRIVVETCLKHRFHSNLAQRHWYQLVLEEMRFGRKLVFREKALVG